MGSVMRSASNISTSLDTVLTLDTDTLKTAVCMVNKG